MDDLKITLYPSIKTGAREAACFAFSNNVSAKLKVILIGFAAVGKRRLAALHHAGTDRKCGECV